MRYRTTNTIKLASGAYILRGSVFNASPKAVEALLDSGSIHAIAIARPAEAKAEAKAKAKAS